jgi:cytochrome c oxidase assembly factor CtaG
VHRSGQRALLVATFLLLTAAYLSPLADWGEHRSFAAHMGQHLLIGDLAALTLVLSGAVGRLPRIVLALALPIWLANLAFWHVPAIYEGALHHGALHEAQHAALWVAGIVVWSAILSGVLSLGARFAVLVGMMVGGLAVSSVFLWWPRVLYSTYAHAHELAGMSPLTDQRVGGGLMLLEGMLVGLSAAGWLIVQALREDVPAAPEGASPSL